MMKSCDDDTHPVSTNSSQKSHSASLHNDIAGPISFVEHNGVNAGIDSSTKTKDRDKLRPVSSFYQERDMHGFLENYKSAMTEFFEGSSSKEFVCGWGAALINITITFPINKIIFRQMLHNVRFGGAFEQIRSEGIMFLYRGVLPPLLQKSVSTSLMFGMYQHFRQPLVASNVLSPVVANATAAMMAGTVEALLAPFERVQTLMQDSGYHKHFKNTSHAMKIILSEYGFKEFYRGLVPILLRNGPSNVLFFGLRDYCNDNIPDSRLWYLKIAKQFMIGACIGSFISCLFYPCNVIKVHVQSQLGGCYTSFSAAAKEVFLERNKSIRGFYRGVYMNCTRSFISWGVINVSYEAIRKIAYD